MSTLTPPRVRAPARVDAVTLRGVAKRFAVPRAWGEVIRRPRERRWHPALRGVDCEVLQGELFGVLGPNGAGKTTLFKILSTLVVPDAGEARVAGADVVREPARVRRLLCPVVADERSLNWRITARENLRLYAALHGLAGRPAAARVEEVLGVVELEGAAATRVGTFSSGMKQRLLLARALLARPRVLLLDEPTRSLDPLSARRFRAFLRDEVVARHGCTVLLATHAPDEALELCDRVAVMDRGRVVALGPADALGRRAARERHRLWTRDPGHPAIGRAAARGVLVLHAAVGEEEGWTRLEVEVPGGAVGAAAVLTTLAAAGVRISRFEPLRPSLAEMIERLIAEAAG